MLRRIVTRAVSVSRHQLSARPQQAFYCSESEPDDGGRSFSEAYVNKVSLMGRVGHPPTEMNTPGRSLYFPLGHKNFASEQLWHTIHVYDQRLKEYCSNRVNTGDRIFVDGVLEYSKPTDERPQKNARVVAKEIKMISRAQRNRVNREDHEEEENM